ncbi:MAG: hypothetical protein Q9169_002817 [Polycauliona sp. 2 TL-2023]
MDIEICSAARGEDEIAAILGRNIASEFGGHRIETESGMQVGALMLLPFWPIIARAMFCFDPLGTVLEYVSYYPVKFATATLKLSSWQRAHEADYIGMLLMTRAGFKPKGAVSIIQKRLVAKEGFKKPDPEGILEEYESWFPDASKWYVLVAVQDPSRR